MISYEFDMILSRIRNIQLADKLNVTRDNTFKVLEADVQGFANPGLYIIAGNPQCGKTSFTISLINAFRYIERQEYIPVLSTDLSSSAWIERYISSLTGIWLEKIQRGKLEADEIALIQSRWVSNACHKLQLRAIRFENENQLVAYFSKWKSAYGSGIFFIDSIQSLFIKNRYTIVEMLSSIKKMCLHLKISIVATSMMKNIHFQSKIFQGFEYYSDVLLLIDTVAFRHEKVYIKVQKNNFGVLNTFVFRPMLYIQKFEDRNF
ncbi:MAG: hypothetical protein KF746_11690 [Chitinophagaceae bacterium]|nr:hypothetical protein [Chitinophagaceae bacterium]